MAPSNADPHEANGAKPREVESLLSPTHLRSDVTGPGERLQELLADSPDHVDDVRGIAIADKSGLRVSSSFMTRANVLTVTAMATMAIQSSQRVYQNLGHPGLSEVVMVGPDSTVFASRVSRAQPSIIVVLEGFAKLGLVRIEVERLSRELS